MIPSNGDGYGGPTKRQRTDTADNAEGFDLGTIQRRRLEKYHEQEQQLLLLQQQIQIQLLLSKQEALSQEQFLATQKQQQDLLTQQEIRKKALEQKLKTKRKIVDGMQCQGVVRSFGSDKFFGFISCPEVSNDVYFRVLPGKQNPVVGQKCAFQLKIARDGLYHAYSVVLLDKGTDEKKAGPESGEVVPDEIDDEVLAAQVEQLRKLQEYQQVQDSMIAQQKEQQKLIESVEAAVAVESYRKNSGLQEDLCGDFQSGKCTRGDKCMFTHQLKRRWCTDFQKGICAFGNKCRWSHAINPRGEKVDISNMKPSTGKAWSGVKTKMCAFYEQGKCTKGDGCTYAHDASDIGKKTNELVTMMTPLGPMKVHTGDASQASVATGFPMDAAEFAPPPSTSATYEQYLEEFDGRLRRRIGWLNKKERFANDLVYDNIAETAAVVGVNEPTLMGVLQRLEDLGREHNFERGCVKNTTAWVVNELWKEGRTKSSKEKSTEQSNSSGGSSKDSEAASIEAYQQQVLAEYQKMMLQAQLQANAVEAEAPVPVPALGQTFQVPVPGEKEWQLPPAVTQPEPKLSEEAYPQIADWQDKAWQEIDDWQCAGKEKKPLAIKPGLFQGETQPEFSFQTQPPVAVPKVIPRRVPRQAQTSPQASEKRESISLDWDPSVEQSPLPLMTMPTGTSAAGQIISQALIKEDQDQSHGVWIDGKAPQPGSAEFFLAKAFEKIEEDKIPRKETLFNVIINGDEHGMELENQDGELKVTAIPDGSQIATWNARNPDKAVQVSDSLFAVNGKPGTPGELVISLFALEPGRQHELKIRRISLMV